MIYCLRFKPGVVLVPSPGGAMLIAGLVYTAMQIKHDLTVTSGADGEHSGPDDPHHFGNAFDVRTHDLPDKEYALQSLIVQLGPLFYAFLEDENTDNEHIHCQVLKGTTYPPNPTETT